MLLMASQIGHRSAQRIHIPRPDCDPDRGGFLKTSCKIHPLLIHLAANCIMAFGDMVFFAVPQQEVWQQCPTASDELIQHP